MKKHYLKIEDKSYRVEVNMNTAEAWERLSGMKIGQFEMQAAHSVKTGGVPTKTIMWWLYCAFVEGEELEGREFTYTLKGLKSVVKPSILTEFAPIFIACYVGESSVSVEKQAANEQKKRSKILLVFHSFFRSPWVRLAGALMLISIAVLVTCSRH